MKNTFGWLQVLLEERFGHQFSIREWGRAKLVVTFDNADGGIVFDVLQSCFFQSSSDIPCAEWDGFAEGWDLILGFSLKAPGVAELPKPLVEKRENYHVVHYDILGLTYWMLSRQEEVGRRDLDEHGRFPARSSHAYKFGYLQRPIVDEWLDILGQVIKRQWPCIELRKHHFKMVVSHDVDFPSRYGFRSPSGLFRAVAGDILKYKKVSGVLRAPLVWFNTLNKLSRMDPYNTFDWLMDVSEKNGLKSAFYFMCGRTDETKDGDYELEHPAICNLMRQIHARGHEIGLHPSYGTYKNSEMIVGEAKRLKRVCHDLGIVQEQWGGRMHYLRFEMPTTLYAWEEAGMTYDSTLGYADFPGFRCGTSFEYLAIDPVEKKRLNLRIRPLIVMEGSVVSDQYLGLKCSQEAIDLVMDLKNKVFHLGGQFTFLWHNSHFSKKTERRFYEKILKAN